MIHVYLRSNNTIKNFSSFSNVYIHHLPLIDISSTSIRNSIKSGESVVGEIDSIVNTFIQKNGWYQ
jgi:nicotinic acid mononucleotide adenylyltransferase